MEGITTGKSGLDLDTLSSILFLDGTSKRERQGS